MRAKIIKLLRKNTGVNLHELGSGNIFLALTPKVQATKEKQVDRILQKLKILFIKIHYPDSGKTAHRIPKKISANHISDKDLLCRIYKQHL